MTQQVLSGSRHLAHWLGWGIVALGASALGRDLLQQGSVVAHQHPVVLAGLFTAAATGIGALPVFLVRRLDARLADTLLGAGAGMMLAAAFVSLLMPGLEAGRALTGHPAAALVLTGVGAALAVAALAAFDRLLPHLHPTGSGELRPDTDAQAQGRASGSAQARVWMFVVAIALHNFPEGLALGAAGGAPALTAGIALQNMPEGLIVALALQRLGHGPTLAVMGALATAVVEPIGALMGALFAGLTEMSLPVMLGFAGGAMLFVVSHEIIPESHRHGHERLATRGLLAGALIMLGLDSMFQT